MSKNNVLEFVREEDFVEYFIFPQLKTHYEDHKTIKSDLEDILQRINNTIEHHINEYIWHKDEFKLTIRTEEHQYFLEENNEKKDILPPHLYGITHYGDNIQDEWFIVFLIYEITKKIPGTIGRVIDSDGEFLLIEAANFLPNWANPDTCEQRAYIFDGHLQLIQNSASNIPDILPVSKAITKIWENPTIYRVSKEIESCINSRIKEFSENMENLFHYQIVRVPLVIAAILKVKPSLIASACRAFCERDAIDMRACRAMRYFPPENRVRIRVQFTRCLYAMIMHNNYIPDRRTGWNLPPSDTEEFKEDILGVKIACGFEILAVQARQNDDIESDRSWKLYLDSLVKKGYFKEYLEGSKDYNRLLEEAKNFYKENRDRFRTAPIVGKEILNFLVQLETNEEQLRKEENNLAKSDPDDWLNISPEELDTMLTSRYGINKLYTPMGNINATEFTQNITEFLEKESDLEGIEFMSTSPVTANHNEKTKPCVDNHITNDIKIDKKSIPSVSVKPDEINFDSDSFQTHVKNFLDFVIPEDDWESTSEMSDYEDDNDLEKNIEDMTNTRISFKNDIKTYMDLMDHELSKTTIGKTFELNDISLSQVNSSKIVNNDIDDFDDIETFNPVNIDVNTLKNMMISYKSQAGAPGPVTNLLGAMGTEVKKNEDNDKGKLNEINHEDFKNTQV